MWSQLGRGVRESAMVVLETEAKNVLEGAEEELEEHVDVLAPGILVLAWLCAVSKRDLHVLRRDKTPSAPCHSGRDREGERTT